MKTTKWRLPRKLKKLVKKFAIGRVELLLPKRGEEFTRKLWKQQFPHRLLKNEYRDFLEHRSGSEQQVQ